jgi:hypothetical protein
VFAVPRALVAHAGSAAELGFDVQAEEAPINPISERLRGLLLGLGHRVVLSEGSLYLDPVEATPSSNDVAGRERLTGSGRRPLDHSSVS